MEPLLFVHIPKTAGTSFRKGVEECLGHYHIFKDYGGSSKQTSRQVRECMYDNFDPFLLGTYLSKSDIKFMTGHYHLSRYSSIFSIENTVTFLRNPVDRFISEYNHIAKHYGYDRSLEEFIQKPTEQNKQSKFLSGVMFDALGFVGISEMYDTSLQLINSKYEIDIPNFQINKGNYVGQSPITEEIRRAILSVNQKDVELYEKAQNILSLRLEMHKQKLPYVRGNVTEYKNARCFGWACFDGSDEPVELELFKNNQSIGVVTAVEWRPYLAAFGIRRSGHVGFSFHVGALSPGDLLEIRVQDTGQVLNTSPGFLGSL